MFKAKQERVALFGGSFDPPHFGHITVVNEALKLLDIDKLIVVPAFLNPFKTDSHASPKQRLLWCKEIFDTLPKVVVDDYEIQQGESTASSKTVSHFQKKYEVKYLIIGADNLISITKWHKFAWLNNNITWVIALRARHKIETKELKDFRLLDINVDISSTQIRNKTKKEEN